LIVAADQVVQFGRPIHAEMPRPTPTKEETTRRTGRPSETRATEVPLRRGGSVPDPQSHIDAVRNAVTIKPRLASR
jgi:hypothetical protein